MSFLGWTLFAAISSTLVACGSPEVMSRYVGGAGASEADLVSRAEADLACPRSEIDIRETVGDDTRDAAGCGRRATYRWRCDGTSYGKLGGSIDGCDWVARGSTSLSR